MDAKSGNGSSGTFIWGVIAGIVALLIAGGLYLSGMLGGDADKDQQPQEQAAVAPEPEEQVTEAEETQTAQSVDEPATVEIAEAQETDETAPEAPSEQTADQGQEEQTTEEAPAQDATAEAEEPDTEQEASADTPPAVVPPVLDQIFVEKDGNALLSGNAEPGSQIRVLLDSEPVHSFTVDNSGQFAEFVAIPFSENARGLVLEHSDGTQSARSDDYLIAALPEPEPEDAEEEQIASAVPTATDEPVTTANTEETQTATDDTDEQVAEEPEAEATDDQQIAVLRSGEEGVELVQSPTAPADAPKQIELDTIGYSDTGDVQLTGRAQDGSAVRLYLDNRLVAELSPDESGKWRGVLEGIDPGVYTLRVDEINTDGTVLSRVETPFKREPVEVLQATEEADPNQAPDEAPSIRSVTVQKGDTLWAISRERFGDGILYVKLFDANRELIRDPDLIYPGQIFTIPE